MELGAFGFWLFYEIMRSRGKRVVCVSYYDIVSEVFDAPGRCCSLPNIKKNRVADHSVKRKMIPLTFCDRN